MASFEDPGPVDNSFSLKKKIGINRIYSLSSSLSSSNKELLLVAIQQRENEREGQEREERNERESKKTGEVKKCGCIFKVKSG